MILYTKQNTNRKNIFQLSTVAEKINGKVFYKKIVNNESAIDFLNSIFDKYEFLKKTQSCFNIATPNRISRTEIGFEAQDGELLSDVILDLYRQYDKKMIVSIIDGYFSVLRSLATIETLSCEFKDVFGDSKRFNNIECLPMGNIDFIFDNVFIKNDQYSIIDYEWTFFFSVPLRFIFFRAILRLYISFNQDILNSVMSIKELFDLTGITEKDINCFIEYEFNFQQYVAGSKIDKDIFLKNYKNIGFFEEKKYFIQETTAQLQETTAQLQETTAQLQETTAQLQETTAQLQEKILQLDVAKIQIQNAKNRIFEVENYINTIKKTIGWRMLNKIYMSIDVIFPKESKQRKIYCSIKKILNIAYNTVRKKYKNS